MSGPLFRIVSGAPSDEELAALTVVVAASGQTPRARRHPLPVGAWASRTGALRRPLAAGPGGWRAAGGPA